MTKLFRSLTLGGKSNPIELKHGVVMAPLTRLKCGEAGAPTELVAKYYTQRATDGGLLIAEATNISATARGYFGAPGIFTEEQIAGWKDVTKAVHAKGGKFFMQLWHTGRVGHPLNQPDGQLPVSSSAVAITSPLKANTREGRVPLVTPRALDLDEIPGVVENYRQAAVNAIEAGCDGVELHAANGYLVEQFLCDSVNQRTDKYGGSVENRARLLFESLEAILSVVDSSRVGIRLSPFSTLFDCTDSDPATTYSYVMKKLNDYDLAYVHIIEPRGFHPTSTLVPKEGVTKYFRSMYHGVVLTASGYEREDAIKVVEEGDADAVVFGRFFISNPDLVKRLKLDAPLNPYDVTTFYSDGEKGYTDQPFMEEQEAN